MTETNLEEIIRDLAARGEISDIGLSRNGSNTKWHATFAMCSKFGLSHAEHDDPVEALRIACSTAGLKRRRPIKVDGKLREGTDEPIVQPIVDVVPDDADDLM